MAVAGKIFAVSWIAAGRGRAGGKISVGRVVREAGATGAGRDLPIRRRVVRLVGTAGHGGDGAGRRRGQLGQAGYLYGDLHVALRGAVVDALERGDVEVVAAAGDDHVALAYVRAAGGVEGGP